MPVTRADEMDALAERVEKLTGPDREVDALVWLAVTPGATREQRTVKSSQGLWPDYEIDETRDATNRLIVVPSYTSSLDAAMSLVPEGLSWTLGQNVHHGYWQASINKLDDDGVPTSVGCSNATKTPYNALTAACLRAHASIIREAGR